MLQPIKTKEDDDFLADLLGEVDTNVPRRIVHSTKQNRSQTSRNARALSPPIDSSKHHTAKRAKTGNTRGPLTTGLDVDEDDDGFTNIMYDDDMPVNDPQPSSPAAKAMERKSQVPIKEEDEEDEDMMEIAHADGIVATSVNMSGVRAAPKIIKPDPYPSPASSSPAQPNNHIDASAWNNITHKLVINSSPSEETRTFGKMDYNDAIEEDGSLRMFWTDYSEIHGSLFLLGKVRNKKSGTFVSCVVKVDNILRKLFFLPRTYRQRHGRDTSEEVEMKDVYEEVDELMGKMNVGMHKIKPCERKYAFELPGIPKEGEYLKLFYPYTSGLSL